MKSLVSLFLTLSLLCASSVVQAAPPVPVSYTVDEIQQQAITEFKAGRFEKAADYYKALSILQPTNTDIMKDLMWSYWNAGKVNDTIETARRVLSFKENDIESLSLLGKAYTSSGNKAEAAEMFEKVVALSPDNAAAKLSLAQLQTKLKNPGKAEIILKELDKDLPSNPSMKQRVSDAWKGLAQTYLTEDQQSKAIDSYSHVTTRSANDGQVQAALARLHTDQKEYGEAETILRKSLIGNTDPNNIYPKLAHVLFLKKDFRQAAEFWSKSAMAFPERTNYKFEYAQSLYFDGQYGAGLRAMEDIAQDAEWGRRAIDFMFNDAIARKEYAAAIKIMEENLTEYRPEDQPRLQRLANAYESLGNLNKAIQILEKCIKLNPDDSAAATSMAICYVEKKDYRKAIQIYQQIMKKNPSATNVLYSMADAYEGVALLKKMLAVITYYREQDPTNPYLLLRQAEILYSLERRKTAKKMISTWLQENEESPSLAILLYHGISPYRRDGMMAHSQHVTLATFESHMKALKEAGFHAVTTSEVAAWYASDKPLPSKPILISFDDGRMDGMANADPVLAKYGMKATMFVIGQNADRNLPNYANWNDLRKFKATGRWDLQAHTDLGHSYIPVTEDGFKGLFLTNRKWLDVEKRLEDKTEWIKRISDDHERYKAKMKAQLGEAPIAFAFPEGDYGQIDVPNAQNAADTNIKIAQKNYRLSFFQDKNGINVKSRDPYHLNRMEPPQDWKGDDLVRHLTDDTPVSRMRLALLHWSVWEGFPHEALRRLEELKASGASEYVVSMEEARILASRGNMVLAKKKHGEAMEALGDGKIPKTPDPVLSENRPVFNMGGDYFSDTEHRRFWTFQESFAPGYIKNIRLRAIHRQSVLKERDVPTVTGTGLGVGLGTSLGLYHSLDLEGVGYHFSPDIGAGSALSATLVSQWWDLLRSEIGVNREPVYGAKALNQNIYQRSTDFSLVWDTGEAWAGSFRGVYSDLSDSNRRLTSNVEFSRPFFSWAYPRVVVRFLTNDTKNVSPLYYSPSHLVENNLGLMVSDRFENHFTAMARYLPGFGKEVGSGTRFIQNINFELTGEWNDTTLVKFGFLYNQTPSYCSRDFSLSLEHRFGNRFLGESDPEGWIAVPEAPQGDVKDAGSL